MIEENGKIEIHIYNNGGQLNLAQENGRIEAQQNHGSDGAGTAFEEKNDTDYMVKMSKDIQQHFVKTEPYLEAVRKWSDSNAILLIGNSGSGKTDNAIMLAVQYQEGYTLNFAEGSDSEKIKIKNVLNKIKNNYEKKEIVIFDDFLGKTRLNTDKEYLNLVIELIKYGNKNPNKKLILNSRITILEDAKIQSDIFRMYLEHDVEVIDISKLNHMSDRCEIFASYIRKYKMQHRMKAILANEKGLLEIVNHPNFSPLIVQKALHSCSRNEKKDLESTFLEMLNKPNAIWESEVKALNKYSKIYLNILYSLSDTWMKQEYVDKAFLHYLSKKEEKYNENPDKTIKRLSNLLKFDEYQRITFFHPSIIDYIKQEMSVQEKEEIMEYALYFEQIERLDESRERIRLLYNDIRKFVSLEVLPYTFSNTCLEVINQIEVKILDYMLKLKINLGEELLILILKNVFSYGRLLLLHSSKIILNVLLLNYNFSEILNNDSYMEELFDFLNYEEIWKLVELLCANREENIDFKTLKPYMQQAILRKLDEAAEDNINEAIQDNILDYVEEYFSNLGAEEEFYYEDVAQEIIEEIRDDMDIESIVKETKHNLCQKHKLCNYEDDISRYDIEIDYNFVEEFIKHYNERE